MILEDIRQNINRDILEKQAHLRESEKKVFNYPLFWFLYFVIIFVLSILVVNN